MQPEKERDVANNHLHRKTGQSALNTCLTICQVPTKVEDFCIPLAGLQQQVAHLTEATINAIMSVQFQAERDLQTL